jgi:hypothetical protein
MLYTRLCAMFSNIIWLVHCLMQLRDNVTLSCFSSIWNLTTPHNANDVSIFQADSPSFYHYCNLSDELGIAALKDQHVSTFKLCR